MSTALELEEIDISIEESKKKIEFKNCLNRLENNPDFKKLIMDGFLESHAVRQVMLKGHPSMQDDGNQAFLDKQIAGIGAFKQYLVSVYAAGMNAEQTLLDDEATREELLKEDLNNG